LDKRSAADWLDAQAAHPLARRAFADHIRSEYTCEPGDFSLLDLARNAALYYSAPDFHTPSYRIIGGNDQIPRAIAAALPDVRLDAVVTSIANRAEEVAVAFRQGDTFHTLTCSFAILAIPLTTAQLIEFDPPLPSAHRRMLNEVSHGAVTKVMIEYRRRFWKEKGWNGRLSTDQHIVQTWDATSHVEGGHGIITAYTGGPPGAKLSALSDEERTNLAISVIERIFPGSSDLVGQTATIAWINEPFTRCSYMALAPNQVTKHWKTLFSPAGRLYFAGEHAAVYQGYMEGAVESGQRAARNIMETTSLRGGR
jgi:monoamine oxidase